MYRTRTVYVRNKYTRLPIYYVRNAIIKKGVLIVTQALCLHIVYIIYSHSNCTSLSCVGMLYSVHSGTVDNTYKKKVIYFIFF